MKSTASTGHQLEFHKRRQLFIGTHNETLSVAAMRVCNIQIVQPSRSSAKNRNVL
jgi:hypothetical protein